VASGARASPNTDFLGMQSEVTRFHIAMFTNDHVKQYHTRLFTFDPIGRIEKRRAAMLADPSHYSKIQQGQCHRDSPNSSILQREEFGSLKESSLTCAMVKTFMKIGVGIEHTAPVASSYEGVHKKQAVHQRVRWETEQYGIELCKQ